MSPSPLFRARARARTGFTLVEVTLAVALALVVTATTVNGFFVIQQLVARIRATAAKNDTAQSLVLWSLTKPNNATAYPAGAQACQIGAWNLNSAGGQRYLQFQICQWSVATGVNPSATLATATLPVVGN
jgi:hypothetical protein